MIVNVSHRPLDQEIGVCNAASNNAQITMITKAYPTNLNFGTNYNRYETGAKQYNMLVLGR